MCTSAEFSEEKCLGAVPYKDSLIQIFVAPENEPPVFEHDVGTPLALCLEPADPRHTALITGIYLAIPTVLPRCRGTKILESVVAKNSVPVVNLVRP